MQTLNEFLRTGDEQLFAQNYTRYLETNMRQNEGITIQFALSAVNHLIKNAVPLQQTTAVVKASAMVFQEPIRMHMQ